MYLLTALQPNHSATLSWVALAGLILVFALRLGADVSRWRARWNAPMSSRERRWIVRSRGRGLSDGTLFTRLARGARAGLVFPGIFAVVIAYYYIEDGRHPGPDTDMLALFLLYLLGSAALCAIIAACTPLALRSWRHAILVGCSPQYPLSSASAQPRAQTSRAGTSSARS
jgi:hypothetical protein